MIEYSYKSFGDESADWLVDKILEANGVISDDSYKGMLVEGKVSTRQVILQFDALVVEMIDGEKGIGVSLFANDGNKELLMQRSTAFLKNKEHALSMLIDYNQTVKAVLEAASKALALRNNAMRPVVTPRK